VLGDCEGQSRIDEKDRSDNKNTDLEVQERAKTEKSTTKTFVF
jgi:hypothetical protein